MKRSNLLLAVVLVVAVVVALEEWRLAGLRGRVADLEAELEAIVVPPPPRPEEPGNQGSVIRATKLRRMKDLTSQRMDEGGEWSGDAAAVVPAVAGGTPAATAEDPAPAAVDPVASNLRDRVGVMYGPLIESFRFTDEERAYFIELLVGGLMRHQDLVLDRVEAAGPAAQAAVDRKLIESEQLLAEELRTFLVDEADFAVYQEYVARLSEQMSAGAQGGEPGR